MLYELSQFDTSAQQCLRSINMRQLANTQAFFHIRKDGE